MRQSAWSVMVRVISILCHAITDVRATCMMFHTYCFLYATLGDNDLSLCMQTTHMHVTYQLSVA